MSGPVRLGVDSGIGTVVLNSARNRNALSAEMRRCLAEALSSCFDDPRVRVVVLTHDGPAFCAGLDLEEARTGDSAAAGLELAELLAAVWSGPKPVVARLAGPARAGGAGLMAACDVAVAADDVTFALTEVRLGVVPAVISVPVLARMLPHAAHELFLTAETFDASRAVAVGLVNRAVPARALDGEVRARSGAACRRCPGGAGRHQGAPARACPG